jgi:DNA-binding transcriptional LysR family regulator
MGVPFLVLTKRHVELTEPGRAFFEEARQAIVHPDRSVQAA